MIKKILATHSIKKLQKNTQRASHTPEIPVFFTVLLAFLCINGILSCILFKQAQYNVVPSNGACCIQYKK